MGEFCIGDVLKAHRGLYWHYGVYVGCGKVVHFSSIGKNEMDASSADIILTTLKTFSRDDRVSLDKLEEATFSPAEIAQRAMSAIGTKKGTYNLISNNCEHFANWCRCGKLVSHQKLMVDKIVGCVLEEFPLGRDVLGAMREYIKEKDSEMKSLYSEGSVDWFGGNE